MLWQLACCLSQHLDLSLRLLLAICEAKRFCFHEDCLRTSIDVYEATSEVPWWSVLLLVPDDVQVSATAAVDGTEGDEARLDTDVVYREGIAEH